MPYRLLLLATAALVGTSAQAQTATRPPPLPPKPVVDTYYGTTITDPHRYFENEKDPVVIDWMKAQGRYTAAVLNSIPKRAALLKAVGDFTAGFDVVNSIQVAGGKTFYEDRAPGSDNFDLMVRDADGQKHKLIDVAALRAAKGNTPQAINYYLASPDGSKVAVGISEGGSEKASLTVYDVVTAKPISSIIPRAEFGATGWSDDGRILFLNQLADLPADAAPTEKYQNSVALAWDLKSAPVPVLSSGTTGPIKVPPAMFPLVTPYHGSPMAITGLFNGVQNEREIWTGPAADAAKPGGIWIKLTGFDDDVTLVDVSGDRLYLLSHKDAPTFKVLMVRAGQPLSSARTIVAARTDRLIEGIGAAADGLYVRARHGLYSELTRVPLDGGPERPVTLPARGSIGEMSTDPTLPGATLIMDSWALPPTTYRYDPASAKFAKLDIGHHPATFDPQAYVVGDLHATAKDGTRVPLSYIDRTGAKHAKPVLLWAYGSYGLSMFPYFSARFALLLQQGVGFATCHVRGGGELGETWRLGGKDAKKPNTWRDLIACGEELIAKGYTTSKQLIIMGGSAGGIPMGRSMEEAPDLFAGVIDSVPVANPVRQEFSPNGVPNIPEYGSVKTEAGFRNLLAMDSYLAVRDGAQYPAIMITTGLNDPRVSSWEPAKLAARLQTSGTKKPVLLRVDEEAGHGIGSTKSQTDALITDAIAFAMWSAGVPGWQPAITPK